MIKDLFPLLVIYAIYIVWQLANAQDRTAFIKVMKRHLPILLLLTALFMGAVVLSADVPAPKLI